MVSPVPYPSNPTSTITTANHTQIRTRPNPTSTTMAQREEEAELRLPEAPAALCANNCGFRGNPATNNLCQSCYSSATRRPSPPIREKPRSVAIRRDEAAAAERAEVTPPPVVKLVERCAGCKRRVGLTGIRCRCGELYCAVHRYTDRHECSYDYKAAGREAIARENPAVRAAKIVRI